MKTQILILSTLVFLGGTVPGSNPVATEKVETVNEQTTSFAFFRTHRQGKAGVTATWGLNNNSGVSEFILKRTYEDPYDEYAEWHVVTMMPCNSARSFKFTESPVSPGMISYQVVAVMNNGATVTSPVLTQRIVSH